MLLNAGKLVVLALIGACGLSVQAAELALLRNGYEIRHQARDLVGENTRLYVNVDRTSYIDVPSTQILGFEKDDSIGGPLALPNPRPDADAQNESADIEAAVAAASKKHAIDADLIASVIRAESSFNPRAVSPKGAQGLMQLMPGTASALGVRNSFEAAANVDGGTRYLRELLLRYNDDLQKALAAYNAGSQRVDEYNGVPPYRETRNYVARIIRDFNRKKSGVAVRAQQALSGDLRISNRPLSPRKRLLDGREGGPTRTVGVQRKGVVPARSRAS